MDKNTKITVAISVAILTIFIGSLYVFGGKSSKKIDETNSSATSTVSTSTISDNGGIYTTGLKNASNVPTNKTEGLSVSDQLADDLVAFSGVDFSDDTWVLVYEDKNGEPSNLLGSGLFFPGTIEGQTPLLRKTVLGAKYYVSYVKDNGDRVFDIAADKPNIDSPVVSFIAK